MSSQHSVERLRKVASLQRLTQHLTHAESYGAFCELRVTATTHHDDWNVASNCTNFARELDADEIGHRFVGENEGKALGLRRKGLQCRATRVEANRLVAELGEYFLGEGNECSLVINNHYRFAAPAR